MTTSLKNASDSEYWQNSAHAEILAVIKKEGQITYNALAAAAQMTGPYKIHRLTLWLEEMMVEDYRNGRPLRAAVVISKAGGGLPARGFFEKAEELGLKFETADRARHYQNYLQTVYASKWDN